MCRSLISPLLLEFWNADTTVIENLLYHGSLLAYSLFEAAPKPISEVAPHFVTNDSCMMVEKARYGVSARQAMISQSS